MTDISVILLGESKYAIKFHQQITKFSSYSRFYAKKNIFEAPSFDTFDFGTPPAPNMWLTPQNLYIFRNHIL